MGTRPYPTVEQRVTDRPLSVTIADAVSEATGVDTESLDPLYSVVEPGVLRSLTDTGPAVDRHVTFTWADCGVTVHADRRVVVRPHVVDGGSE
jgi:hypothetical protein